jgi:hypothetical protein
VVIGGEFMPDEGKEFLDNTNSEDQDRQTQAGSRLGFIGVSSRSPSETSWASESLSASTWRRTPSQFTHLKPGKKR